MMISITKLVILLVGLSLLNACASYVQPKLQSSDIDIQRQLDAHIETILVQPANINNEGLVKSIKNEKEEESDDKNRIHSVKKYNTYSKWRTALERAVTVFGIFNIESKNIYSLRVNVLYIKFPSSEAGIQSNITARYEIIDTRNSVVVFSREIQSQSGAEVHYFVGNYRWQDALDRAVNNNVKLFIEALLESEFDSPEG